MGVICRANHVVPSFKVLLKTEPGKIFVRIAGYKKHYEAASCRSAEIVCVISVPFLNVTLISSLDSTFISSTSWWTILSFHSVTSAGAASMMVAAHRSFFAITSFSF